MPSRLPRTLVVLLAIGFLLAAPLIASPLGEFAPPLALLLVLPPIAVGLSALGWGRWLGEHLRARVPGRERPAALFGIWSAVSALLSLDVAAVAAADVGMEVAGDDPTERDLQLRAAVLGSNLGSLLFPFSNLTNLLLVAATGISFTAYVSAAIAPQLVVVGVGFVVLWLAGRRGRGAARLRSRWARRRMQGRPWARPGSVAGRRGVTRPGCVAGRRGVTRPGCVAGRRGVV